MSVRLQETIRKVGTKLKERNLSAKFECECGFVFKRNMNQSPICPDCGSWDVYPILNKGEYDG